MLVREIHQESRLRKQRPSVLCVKWHFFSSWLLVVEDFAISLYIGSQSQQARLSLYYSMFVSMVPHRMLYLDATLLRSFCLLNFRPIPPSLL
ncbi:hypothetical protein NC653_001915 [Populus alba x Populus x berolinensis]|uniref:Uncharacterized protein n=1 Tax=Populus alba x Populus x berolinensis TaxID=444605 RepID=A0AAD6WGM1_9ROSI|nr:hypothetical protein NC653_001915 [Populus alba x Populus x berolinensis]